LKRKLTTEAQRHREDKRENREQKAEAREDEKEAAIASFSDLRLLLFSVPLCLCG
jgi:CRISPR/Cas system CMR subunit Cmr4 (Cas7 group RAMP superfamily)